MAYCRKGTYTEATDEEIAQNKAEKTEKTIYVSHEGKEEGKKGLSVLYFGNLLGFADRNLFVESGDDTIIVFDEADWNDAGFQALQFEMINAGYDCIRMSATFPGTPFSATSTYPMMRMFSGKLDPKMPAGVMRIDNSEQAEIIENMRGLEPNSIKFQDEQGLPIPVEVNLEERIRAEQYDENCEDVSCGQPYGSLGIVDGRRDRGYTPDIDTVICSGVAETKNLAEYFTYTAPKLGYTPISSLVQQMGRCAAMVKACFDGNIKQINDKAYKQIYNIDILRGALAYPDPKTFGKAPEELLIGLKITDQQRDKQLPIDNLE
ncbi:1177_t:CDS:2 [Paraglomus brasilianum]|uniref:1177_t:CDS:1 n=1 Tax=Paraglomus brasilianum TaxID=144538 RepID=A0A9N9FNC7_9GLOM|nr:1177_t:CDS:2 [Paraglomus brasilianum]